MNRDDLLKLLDLDGRESIEPKMDEPLVDDAPQSSGSPTALVVDSWSLRRGRDLITESSRLAATGIDSLAAADFFTVAFVPAPQWHDDCVDPRRREFLQQLVETPEYQSLHASTRLDDTASAIAATAYAEQFAELPRKSASRDDREMATLRAVGRALVSAREEVGRCAEAMAAFGIGGIGDSVAGRVDPAAIAALYRRVRDHPTLRRLAELAGRYRRLAQSAQRTKESHGLDDLVGVEMDGDIARLLPSELVGLAIPEREDDALRRLVERQMMCRTYRSVEPIGRGPILVVVDESGSMNGDKVHTAKALALALAWVARQQHRWCGLIAFSGDTGERLLALPPTKWDEHALADWLIAFLGGGSSRDVPVAELPDYYQRIGAPPGVTDVIIITDAICQIPEAMQESFRVWKQSVQARVIALVIDHDPGDLAQIADETHRVSSLAVDQSAIRRVLAV